MASVIDDILVEDQRVLDCKVIAPISLVPVPFLAPVAGDWCWDIRVVHVTGQGRADPLLRTGVADKANIANDMHLGRSEVLRSLIYYLRALGAWAEEALDHLPRKDERGPSAIRRTLRLFKKQRWETSERRGGDHMGFFELIDAILN